MKTPRIIVETFDRKSNEFVGTASMNERCGICKGKNEKKAGQEHRNCLRKRHNWGPSRLQAQQNNKKSKRREENKEERVKKKKEIGAPCQGKKLKKGDLSSP